ncbi:MAG: hypothetical protein JW934_11865 [Anaerolineae bacterium]|nr:hypothetical protein [Anaerolineae bacterium]
MMDDFHRLRDAIFIANFPAQCLSPLAYRFIACQQTHSLGQSFGGQFLLRNGLWADAQFMNTPHPKELIAEEGLNE